MVKGEISPSNLERSLRYALKLADTLAELKRLTTRDALTGLLNRRELNRIMAEEAERSMRFGRSFSLVMLDLDHFKSVNDTHGHAAGDLVLQEASKRARECLRPARSGGEEIAVLLIELDEAASTEVAERIVRTMRETPFGIGGGTEIAVTVSAGLATLPGVAKTSDELMAAADKALYAAKANGRDRLEIASAQA